MDELPEQPRRAPDKLGDDDRTLADGVGRLEIRV
jgi:hypothetical protein